jgi:hypothetical protein
VGDPDFGTAWDIVAEPVTAILHSRQGSTYTQRSITHCFFRAVQQGMMIGPETVLDSVTHVVHFWKAKLDDVLVGLRPYQGDRVTVEGATYTVQEVQWHNRKRRYRCMLLENR